MKLKPIVKWSGGKRDEIKEFSKFYPKNFNRFIEPFAGGAAVYFNLNFDGSNVINDIHPELINFYRQIKLGHQKEIYDIVNGFGLSERDYYFVRGGSKKIGKDAVCFSPKNDIELAARFIYLRRTCFRGMIRYNNSGGFNVPWGKYKKVSFEDLLNEDYFNLLNNTEILNTDYKDIFEKYNSKENFVFLDPPYDSVFNDYGGDNFTRQSQIELSEIFKTTENKCMIVIGGSDFVRELYDGYIIHEYPKKYSFKIYGGRVGDEINLNHLIISNYDVE